MNVKFKSQINAKIQFSDFRFFENLDMLVRFKKIVYCFEISETSTLNFQEENFVSSKYHFASILELKKKCDFFFQKLTYVGEAPLSLFSLEKANRKSFGSDFLRGYFANFKYPENFSKKVFPNLWIFIRKTTGIQP